MAIAMGGMMNQRNLIRKKMSMDTVMEAKGKMAMDTVMEVLRKMAMDTVMEAKRKMAMPISIKKRMDMFTVTATRSMDTVTVVGRAGTQ